MLSIVNRRRFLRLRSKTTSPVNGLRLFWVFAVLWWEYCSFVWNVAWCRWPKRAGNEAFHVLIVADPQVPRPIKGWVPTLVWLKHHIVNHNLRKNWNAAKTKKPDMVVFLGDMLRQGSKTADMAEYGQYVNRFKTIFRMKNNIPRYFVPGNHDVGLGSNRELSVKLRDRFEHYFERTNQVVHAGNHTLIFLDAPALVEEDYRRHGAGRKFDDWSGAPGGSIDFLKHVANTRHDEPAVLFSHIPLWRPDGASCGPMREFGNIRRGVGKGYQSLLGKDTSNFVLESAAPSLIFSADDHDYCDYTHPPYDIENHSTSVREVTVKTFSMATKVRQPGFQLLSLFMPQEINSNPPSHADALCLLPSQSSIYTHGYLPLFVVTLVVLLVVNLRRKNSSGHQPFPDRASGFSPTNPSPPVSPIHYKSSRSLAPGLLRSAIPYASLPGTPLGSAPFQPPHSATSWDRTSSPPVDDDDDAQELVFWHKQQQQQSDVKLSPYIVNGSPGVDSSCYLPSSEAKNIRLPKRTVWTSTLGSEARLLTSSSSWTCRQYFPSLPKRFVTVWRTILCAGRKRTHAWHTRFIQDVVQVTLIPAFLYILMVLWSSF